jgi:hypothetical protein
MTDQICSDRVLRILTRSGQRHERSNGEGWRLSHVYRTVPVPVYELAVELGKQGDAVGEAKLSTGGRERLVLRGVAPLTLKLALGSVRNTATRVGSLTQSCAQASRARSDRTALV